MLPALLSLQACHKDPDKMKEDRFNHVLILYSAGCNDLSSYLQSDIRDIIDAGATLPKKQSGKAFIIVTQKRNGDRATSPYIIRARRTSKKGYIVCDTLRTLPAGMQIADPDVMHDVLSYIRTSFPSDKYGMVFSSHSTGWLPKGYYDRPRGSVFSSSKVFGLDGKEIIKGKTASRVIPYYEKSYPDGIPVKSIGRGELPAQEGVYEMDLKEFADAIPMQMEYILFDVCFFGGVEAAYELKDKAKLIGASQAEVLADGFVYRNIISRLMDEYDPEAVCRDYYERHEMMTGLNKSATISLIRTSELDKLASVCRGLFSKYRKQMDMVNAGNVQRFFRFDKHWFYDLEDIMVQSGISEEDLIQLKLALKGCVAYEAHTEMFMNAFKIRTSCGLSMYLPCMGSGELDDFYRNLAWNKASGLVE